jgi:hypothetical protein
VAPRRGSGFRWTAERQIIFHRGRVYMHKGWTPTAPSHDLAHLLIAMSSDLHWLPKGSPDQVRISEYNAVLLERLLSNTYNCVALRLIEPGDVVSETLDYARWFVEKHYAPFPVAAEEAYRQFCGGIDAGAVASLAPYFFVQRARELRARDRNGCWSMRVKLRVSPLLGRKGRQFQLLVREEMKKITSRRPQSGRRASRR